MRDRGFWATLIGGVVGGCIGFVGGAVLGWAVAPESEGFEGLEYVFAVAAFVAWLGSLGGAYLALRLGGVDRRGETIRWLTALAPPLVGGGSWWAVSLTDADDFGSNFIPYVIFATSVLATAYLARRLGTRQDIREL